MTTSRKPPELKADEVTNKRLKSIIRKITHASDGLVFVYAWNIEVSKNPPLGLFIEADHIATACEAVEEYGGKKSELKDGAIQFDLTDACGVPGNHMVFYKSGKIQITTAAKGNVKNSSIPPDFDFYKTVLIDIVDSMS